MGEASEALGAPGCHSWGALALRTPRTRWGREVPRVAHFLVSLHVRGGAGALPSPPRMPEGALPGLGVFAGAGAHNPRVNLSARQVEASLDCAPENISALSWEEPDATPFTVEELVRNAGPGSLDGFRSLWEERFENVKCKTTGVKPIWKAARVRSLDPSYGSRGGTSVTPDQQGKIVFVHPFYSVRITRPFLDSQAEEYKDVTAECPHRCCRVARRDYGEQDPNSPRYHACTLIRFICKTDGTPTQICNCFANAGDRQRALSNLCGRARVALPVASGVDNDWLACAALFAETVFMRFGSPGVNRHYPYHLRSSLNSQIPRDLPIQLGWEVNSHGDVASVDWSWAGGSDTEPVNAGAADGRDTDDFERGRTPSRSPSPAPGILLPAGSVQESRDRTQSPHWHLLGRHGQRVSPDVPRVLGVPVAPPIPREVGPGPASSPASLPWEPGWAP